MCSWWTIPASSRCVCLSACVCAHVPVHCYQRPLVPRRASASEKVELLGRELVLFAIIACLASAPYLKPPSLLCHSKKLPWIESQILGPPLMQHQTLVLKMCAQEAKHNVIRGTHFLPSATCTSHCRTLPKVCDCNPAPQHCMLPVHACRMKYCLTD